MKHLFFKLLTIGLSIFPAFAFSQITYEVKSHAIVVSGSSNLHDWTATVGTATGNCKVDTTDLISEIKDISIVIDVQTLKSSKGGIMDSKMYNALKTEQYPKMIFKSVQSKILSKTTGITQVSISGNLTIAGKTQKIEVTGFCQLLQGGLFLTMGSKKLKMSDFGVEPPNAMLGTLKTDDEISISFKITLIPWI
ncbi:MAG: YceI family protein [Bacteroidales bacterium]|nr:YceI family protein [Bacteroidales bacterium]